MKAFYFDFKRLKFLNVYKIKAIRQLLNGKQKSYVWEMEKELFHHYWNTSLTLFRTMCHIKKYTSEKNTVTKQHFLITEGSDQNFLFSFKVIFDD